jgi:FO synthase
MRHVDDLGLEEYRAAIAVTRLVLGPKARVQAPPNLVDSSEGSAECRALLDAGVDEWGGVSPVTPDHVNPERPWPQIDELARRTADAGFALRERLTAYPPYLREPWLDPRLRGHVEALAGPDGLAVPGRQPSGRPWQEPDPHWGSSGRTDLHATIDTAGRTRDRRADFDEVYGDWGLLAEDSAAIAARAPGRLDAHVKAPLWRAAEDPSGIDDGEALALMQADGPELEAHCALADDIRRDVVGDEVTFVVNRNINFTNVCYTGCRFCAFAQRRTDADAYTLSLDEVGLRAEEAWAVGATEVCMQGGIHPDLPGTAYFDLVTEVKRRVPDMHVHAFSPLEIVNGAARTGLTIEDWLVTAREAGLDTIPGTAAEILDDEVRWILTKGKLPASTWVEVVSTAHRAGLRSSATMMYGHVDTPAHWVAHLRLLGRVQEETGGFTEFVALPFVHQNAPVYLAGIARPGPTIRENRAVHAMARLLLHGRIDHVQASWVKLGVEGTRQVLRGGADDVGGTLMEETISRMAGSTHGSRKSVGEIEELVAGIDRPARQRTTTYGEVPPERLAAARGAAVAPRVPIRLLPA